LTVIPRYISDQALRPALRQLNKRAYRTGIRHSDGISHSDIAMLPNLTQQRRSA